jgi:hypothetical protein
MVINRLKQGRRDSLHWRFHSIQHKFVIGKELEIDLEKKRKNIQPDGDGAREGRGDDAPFPLSKHRRLVLGGLHPRVGLLVDSEIVLSTRYGKTMVFINKTFINRDRLSTRPYQQRPLINKVDSW